MPASAVVIAWEIAWPLAVIIMAPADQMAPVTVHPEAPPEKSGLFTGALAAAAMSPPPWRMRSFLSPNSNTYA